MAASVIKDLFQDLTANAKLPSDAIKGSNTVVKSVTISSTLDLNTEILIIFIK